MAGLELCLLEGGAVLGWCSEVEWNRLCVIPRAESVGEKQVTVRGDTWIDGCHYCIYSSVGTVPKGWCSREVSEIYGWKVGT